MIEPILTQQFELAWKFLKKYFVGKGIMLNYPKEVLKEAFAVGIVNDEDLWIYMLADCNMKSHNYDEKLADEIYKRIRNYVPAIKVLLNTIDSSLKNKI